MKRFAHPPIAVALVSAFAILLGLALLVPAGVHAQQKPAPAKAAPAGSGQDRIGRIEEQLLDMQGIIGTLQSLVSGGGGAAQQANGAPPMVAPRADTGFGGASGDLGQRVDVIETQIRALSGQMEQITNQLSQIQASIGGGGAPGGQSVPPAAAPGAAQQGQLQLQPPSQQAPAQQPVFGSPPTQPGQQPPQPQQSARRGLGAIPQAPQGDGFAPSRQPAAAPANPNTRAVYETAYNHLLRRDFASAEAGFTNFLRAHPQDPLAGNAQYWLGETYYVRGKYRKAADSFLTGYRTYKSSDKAPASLLKLGMSLHQLGEKDAACATFSELSQKYPRAAQHLKQRAATESRRSGC